MSRKRQRCDLCPKRAAVRIVEDPLFHAEAGVYLLCFPCLALLSPRIRPFFTRTGYGILSDSEVGILSDWEVL